MVDPDFPLQLNITLNGSKKPCVALDLPRARLDVLTESEALEMALDDVEVSAQIRGHQIIDRRFKRDVGVQAVLDFTLGTVDAAARLA